MRQIKYVVTGEIKLVSDQEATDAIAAGTAVPSIDEYVAPEVVQAPENAAFVSAPETL